jgi:hypothetical protein
MRRLRLRFVVGGAVAAALAGCGAGNDTGSTDALGRIDTGAAEASAGTGGARDGGSDTRSGGAGGNGSGAGGATAAGGSNGAGGQVGTGGGGSGAGGKVGTGGSGAGGSGTGGKVGTGGAVGAGGMISGAGGMTSGAGGMTAAGGRTGSGVTAVATNRYDDQRSGANMQETILTTTNVGSGKFGLQFSRAVDGQIYAQPLYLAGVNAPDGRAHDVVYVATAHNTVYAFDADDPAASTPLWQRSLGPAGSTSVFSCTDMTPEVGITATPAIDTATGALYVVAKSLESGSWIHRLHVLDVGTGAELPGSPVVITATVPGTSDGTSMVTFNATNQVSRPGLFLRNGTVYFAYASHCDTSPFHGWIFAYAYNGAQLTQTHAVMLTPTGWGGGGIWQSGVGLSASSDSLFFAAGNGSTDPFASTPIVAEGVARLSLPDLTQRDYWIPTQYTSLNNADADLSSGAILMPHNLLMTGSKDGRLYVLDSTNLGGYHTDSDHIIQTVTTPGKASGQQGHLHGGPIYFNLPGGGGEIIYMWPENAPLVGYRLDPTARTLGGTPVQTSTIVTGHPGGMLSLSANGSTAGTAVLWASAPKSDAWHQTAPGILYALDASDVTKLLWSSDQNAARDGVGNFAKFNTPVVANGRVYMATFSNTLQVYGLLP